MIIWILLFLSCLYILSKTTEPDKLREVKEKYKVLQLYFQENDDPDLGKLAHPLPVTGFYKLKESVGYNINKGSEIGVCLDGSPNEIFHVLLHELAHCTVSEYDHSKKFWENFKKLKNIAVTLKIYEPINESTPFCGKHIRDP